MVYLLRIGKVLDLAFQALTLKERSKTMLQQEMLHRSRRISRQFPYHVCKAVSPLLDLFPPVCSGEFSLKLVRLVNEYRYYFGKGV